MFAYMRPFDALARILLLFLLENELDEELLKFLVAIVYAELFKAGIELNKFLVSMYYILNQAIYPENPAGTPVIVGSTNMGYDIHPTNQESMFRPNCVPSAR